jgi:hypothetical protein
VRNADDTASKDEARKILQTRFIIAQLLAADGHSDEALAEIHVLRPLLVEAFGDSAVQVHNLDKQAARLSSPP